MAYSALVLGGLMAVAASSYTVANLQDQTVWRVTVPGLVGAIGLFFVYLINVSRVAEKHQLATIIRKLSGDTADDQDPAAS